MCERSFNRPTHAAGKLENFGFEIFVFTSGGVGEERLLGGNVRGHVMFIGSDDLVRVAVKHDLSV